MDSSLIKDRQTMSTDGIIIITLIVAQGMLVHDPLILSRGYVEYENSKALTILKNEIKRKTEKLLLDKMDPEDIEHELKKEMKKHIFKNRKRNALIEIQVMEI